jgi:spermidine synthase
VSPLNVLVYCVFFLSGATALIFESLWFRQAGLALGNSVWASSLVLAAFMGGLALGNALAGRLGHQIRRPLRFYAGLEIIIGVTGVGLVLLLPSLTPLLAPVLRPLLEHGWALNSLRLGLAYVLLLIPATAMGATLPVMVAALFRVHPHFGRVLGGLYGWNTLGAVLGVVAAETVVVGWFGIRGTALFAASGNLVAAGAAFALSRYWPETAAGPEAQRQEAQGRFPRPAVLLLAAAFLCGGILLALEVIWFRFLQLFILGSDLTFAIMLAVVLAGIGAGGLAASWWARLDEQAHEHLPALALLSGTVCVALYASFPSWLPPPGGDVADTWREVLVLALPLMFPVSLLSGLLFTFLGAALNRILAAETRSAGFLTLANTTGAMIGALVAGFVLLPWLGMEISFGALAAAYGAAALIILAGLVRPTVRWRRAVLVVTGLAFLASVAAFPTGLMESRFLQYPIERFAQIEGAEPVEIREGLTETITYLQVDSFGSPFYHRLVTNGFSMSATHLRAQRYMRLFVYLPVAVHPAPKDALLICYGVGVTAKALTDTAELESIDVIDTSADILEMNRIVYPDPEDHPLNDPRVRVHVEDGRHFLQLTDRRYDIITGEPPPPKLAGVTSLYTREYFQLIHDRLAEGGIATYWLPVEELYVPETKAIIRAFCDAFSDCSLWSGSVLDWMLVGTRNATGPVTAERFVRQWQDPVVGPELRALAVEVPEQLGALFIAGADDLDEMTRDTPPLDDDHPRRLLSRKAERSEVVPIYRQWLDENVTRERFARSRIVERLWPEAVRHATPDYFRFQAMLDHLAFREQVDIPATLPMLHDVQVRSDLRTLSLLLLGSNPRRQETMDLAMGRGEGGPLFDYLLGLRALSERHYDPAAQLLLRTIQAGDRTPRLLWYEIYALCMSGRLEQAVEVARASGLTSGRTDDDRRVWRFLVETFGLPPS